VSGSAALSSVQVRALVRLGLVLCLVAALASVWEVLTLQAPDSPFHVGVLSGPVAQLRSFSFGFGVGALLLAWLWPPLYARDAGKLVALAFMLGAGLHVAALAYAASHGLAGAQLLDPRLDARLVVYARGAAQLLVLWALGCVCWRALRLR
jgi:hypothetical protein